MRLLFSLVLFISVFSHAYSQESCKNGLFPLGGMLPKIALKGNLLAAATTTINIGGEFLLSSYLTLDASINYIPWQFSNNKKWKHVLIQPELRYWINEPFNRHFVGAHLLYARYNVGNLDLPLGIFPGLKRYRYQGDACGIGISYGYQWILSPRWNLEASFGFGYMYLNYSQYESKARGRKVNKDGPNYYLGPTKVAISLMYIIK